MSKPDEKMELRNKLREKMMAKRINRMGKAQQKSMMNTQLKKMGVDPEKFLEKMSERKK